MTMLGVQAGGNYSTLETPKGSMDFKQPVWVQDSTPCSQPVERCASGNVPATSFSGKNRAYSRQETPAEIRERNEKVKEFQALLRAGGVPSNPKMGVQTSAANKHGLHVLKHSNSGQVLERVLTYDPDRKHLKWDSRKWELLHWDSGSKARIQAAAPRDGHVALHEIMDVTVDEDVVVVDAGAKRGFMAFQIDDPHKRQVFAEGLTLLVERERIGSPTLSPRT